MSAVAFGHASSTVKNVGATSATWAHDCTGDNYLIVSVNHRLNPGTASCTYNGTSMTLLQTTNSATNFQTFFGLANPTSGSNNIVASWTNSVNVGAVGMSFSNVASLGTIIQASVGAGSSAYGATGTLTANDMLVGASGVPDVPSTISVNTGTERAEGGNAITDATCNGGTNVGTGSVSLLWSYSSSGDVKTYIAVPLIGSASVNSGFFMAAAR